jgi:hypothetical protein
MKIDVEGWELRVLQGAATLLRRHPPRAIVLEAPCDSEGNIKVAGLTDYLTGLGYSVSRICRLSGIVDLRENYLALRAE